MDPLAAPARRLALPVRVLRALARARAGGRRRPADVPAFIARAALRLVAEADARFAVEARRGTRAEPVDARDCARLERASGRRGRPSPALREAARRLGAQLLRSRATRLAAAAAIAAYRERRGDAAADRARRRRRRRRASPTRTRRCSRSTTTRRPSRRAALKLLPLDPAVTARWLAELAPAARARPRARIAADHGPLPAPAAVAIELSAPIHLEQRERLFAS